MPTSYTPPSRITTIVCRDTNLGDDLWLAVDRNGNLYISANGDNRIHKMTRTGDMTPAGTGQAYYISGIALDSKDNLYIADSGHRRVLKVAPDGTVSTVAGNGQPIYSSGDIGSGNGGSATNAVLGFPIDVAFDGDENLYILTGMQICMVNRDGNISTVVGNGEFTSMGDDGPALSAGLLGPNSLAIDRKGNLYICQVNNRIRKVDSKDKKIRNFAGMRRGFQGDGGLATQASLNIPEGIAVDTSGNLYIADTGNNRIRIVDREGKINTVAGRSAYKQVDGIGDGGLATDARVRRPRKLAIDSKGNLYIAESYGDTIRRVELPTFAIPHTSAYDFGTNPFSVMAVISPETIKETSSGTQNVIATGNIISKYMPYQKEAGGWELAIVADPPGKEKGTYLSFSVYSKAGSDGKVNRCEVLAPLKDQYIDKSRNANASEATTAGDLFKKYMHIVTAVKDASTVRLYLDGVSVAEENFSGAIDVTNAEPLNIGKLLPTPPEKGQPQGLVRKVSLWNKALNENDVINYKNCLMNSAVAFKTDLHYKLEYFEPKSSGKPDFEVEMTGTLSFRGVNGVIYTESIKERSTFQPQVPNLDDKKLAVARKIFTVVELADLKNFNFTIITDSQEFKVTITATHPDLNKPEITLTESDTTSFEPLPPTDLINAARDKAGNSLVSKASQPDQIQYGYDYNLYAEIKIWEKENCVGFWNLDGNGTNDWIDLSKTANGVPANQRIVWDDLPMVLPVRGQDQQKDNWCWAATSVSIETFYNPHSESQCEFVTKILRDPISKALNSKIQQNLSETQSCCNSDVECNYGLTIDYAMKAKGVSLNSDGRGSPPTFQECLNEINKGHPIAMGVRSSNGNVHWVCFSGLYKKGSEEWAIINDSWSGVSDMPFETFKAAYPFQGNATWYYTMYSRPIWVS